MIYVATKDNYAVIEIASDYNTSQLRQVFLCCDKSFSIKLAQGRIVVAIEKILLRHDIQNSQPRATKSLSRQRLFLSR